VVWWRGGKGGWEGDGGMRTEAALGRWDGEGVRDVKGGMRGREKEGGAQGNSC